MPIRQSVLRWSLVLVLLLLWLGFAAWQWHELVSERQQAEDSLARQCKTAHHLLVSSILSHRRMGPAFDAMTQVSLEEIVKSEFVAVGIADSEPNPAEGPVSILAAGDISALDPAQPVGVARYRWTGSFRLNPDFGSPAGGGLGGGRGGGFGGRGRGRSPSEAAAETSRFQPGRSYTTTFVLDRSDVDRRRGQAASLRVGLVATAGLIVVLLGVAWLANVRLLEARGRERILQTEADHLREMGQAAAGLAHETRNPLGLVRGWTQRLAQQAPDAPEVQRQAQAVIEECDRVTARINQFLAFAKPCNPHRQEVDLEDLVAELKAILEPDLEAKQLAIQCRSEIPRPVVSVDREMFRQVVFNLVNNAIAFSPHGGVIEIALLAGHHGGTRIEVADRGPGVGADRTELLFTPYYTTRNGGTGLGLAIVRRIARAHGWQAGFQPRPEGGSIFWLADKA